MGIPAKLNHQVGTFPLADHTSGTLRLEVEAGTRIYIVYRGPCLHLVLSPHRPSQLPLRLHRVEEVLRDDAAF